MSAARQTTSFADDPNGCSQALQLASLTPACDPSIWDDWDTPALHQFCAHTPSYYSPVQAIGCYNSRTHQWRYAGPTQIIADCMALAQQDPAWQLASCYVCCSGPALPVATPSGPVPVSTLGKGDHVLAATLKNGKLAWSPVPLAFSQGVLMKGTATQMIRVELGTGIDHRAVVLASDQVVLLVDGTLTTVDRLAPGQLLMGESGQPVPVANARSAENSSGVHCVATSTDFNGTFDGHLIGAAGIVCGDYTLQLHFLQLSASFKTPGYDAQPRVGTPQYTTKYPQTVAPSAAANHVEHRTG